MPGKWGGAHRARPPRSANELGCQANGGARAGAPPPRSANDIDGSHIMKGNRIITAAHLSLKYNI